ncbi:MAG: T9SS type A sorting domain-containing protein, partial [Bacteroidetes bacterium]|nr:T9SS type A sorting domain-containing protein [Bacteroidota bacterium]
LCLALQDMHAAIEDVGLDSVAGQSLHYAYVPGAPLLWVTGWHEVGNFGAALTPMPDSSLLVYRTVTGHPLGFVPGDIVLGYDGIPWTHLCRTLLEIGLPIQQDRNGTRGSSPRSWTHGLLASAGKNWGLFDTIDVAKHATGDTLHLPTAALAGQPWNQLFGNEQLAVPGVSMPNLQSGEHCTWGVVENTSIGYIYICDWFLAAGPRFAGALNDLLNVQRVSGLIIDSRHNNGGTQPLKKSTLDPLFNFNPAGPSRWRAVVRGNPSDHLSFSQCAMFDSAFQMDPSYFDRPIAFLTGPHTSSGAELIAFEMRSHPMVRFFGLPTSGAYPATAGMVSRSREWGSWNYLWYQCQPQSLFPGESYLNHMSFPVDEEVWLTRAGVVNGQDDVVQRALSWMSTLAYAHTVRMSGDTLKGSDDSLIVLATVENPLGHGLVLSGIVTDVQGNVMDSLLLKNDGSDGDETASDSVWGGLIKGIQTPGLYSVSVRTDDTTAGTYRKLPNAVAFFVPAVGIAADADNLPKCFSLSQNYPNPFNPITTIMYDLPRSSRVKLALYDLLGREVFVMVDERADGGRYKVLFDGSRLSSGVYFYRLQAGDFTETKGMTLLR